MANYKTRLKVVKYLLLLIQSIGLLCSLLLFYLEIVKTPKQVAILLMVVVFYAVGLAGVNFENTTVSALFGLVLIFGLVAQFVTGEIPGQVSMILVAPDYTSIIMLPLIFIYINLIKSRACEEHFLTDLELRFNGTNLQRLNQLSVERLVSVVTVAGPNVVYQYNDDPPSYEEVVGNNRANTSNSAANSGSSNNRRVSNNRVNCQL